MRTIDSTITTVLSGAELTIFWLVDFTIGGVTHRFTNFEVGINVTTIETSGYFQPLSWEFGGTSHSLESIVDDVDVKLSNLNDRFTGIFIEEDVQGSICNLWGGVMDTDGSVIGVYRIFTGEIDEWRLDEEDLEFSVVSELYRWSHSTIKKHSSSCRWRKFKGTECKYSGSATWCDRSYTRCEALSNQVNFGGFRWLPDIEDKEIWWGRKRLQRK